MAATVGRIRLHFFLENLWEWRGTIFGIAALFSLVSIFASSMYYDNPLPLVVGIALVVLWIIAGAIQLHWEFEKTKQNARTVVRRNAQLLSVFGIVSVFFGVAPLNSAWVIPNRGETSFTKTLFWMPPFFTPFRYTVNLAHNQIVNVTVVTRDGLPLSCSVSASGIELDQRDTLRLEHYLLNVAATRDPNKYLDSEVMAALANSSVAALGNKTGEEIGRQGQFLIPYKIGTPMGDTLARTILHWSGGAVSFNCSLSKFQS